MKLLLILAGLIVQSVLSCSVTYAKDAVRSSGGPPPEKGSLPIHVADRLLTARINESTLQRVLGAIAGMSGIRIFTHELSDERVTVTFNRLPFDEALRQILRGKNVVLLYAEPPEPANGVSSPRLSEVHVYAGPSSGRDGNPDIFRGADQHVALNSPPADVKGERGGRKESAARSEEAFPREMSRGQRKRSAEDLGKRWSPEALLPLTRALSEDDDPSVRASVVTALGTTWNGSAVASLAATLLSDQEPDVREAAARALGETWSEAAAAALGQALLGDPNRYVREAAAHALGEIGNLDAVISLRSALRDRDPSVREHAAQALGRSASPQAMEALSETSLHDKDSWVKARAADSLQKILKAY